MWHVFDYKVRLVKSEVKIKLGEQGVKSSLLITSNIIIEDVSRKRLTIQLKIS
jgi:hypothetical protein